MRRPTPGLPRPMLGRLLVPAALVAAAVLGGCGEITPVAPADVADAPDCLADQVVALLHMGTPPAGRTVPDAGDMPDGFTPVAAVLCEWPVLVVAPPPAPTLLETVPTDAPTSPGADPADPGTDPAGGGSTIDEVWFEGDLGPLLDALSRPDDAPTADQVCPAMLQLSPVLFLVDASGRGVLVRWPRTSCGYVQAGAFEALGGLTETGRTTRTAP